MREVDRFGLLRLPETSALHRHEARTEAIDAGVILVARRLVDGALAAELGFNRCHRHAVRFDPAVATAFADQLVDHHTLRGIGVLAALAAAALLRGASLIVEQDRATGRVAQLALHTVELVAMMDGDVGGEITGRILGW